MLDLANVGLGTQGEPASSRFSESGDAARLFEPDIKADISADNVLVDFTASC